MAAQNLKSHQIAVGTGFAQVNWESFGSQIFVIQNASTGTMSLKFDGGEGEIEIATKEWLQIEEGIIGQLDAKTTVAGNIVLLLN